MIREIGQGDDEYPKELLDLGDDAPDRLWVRGEWYLASMVHDAVSIVGARAATAYGLHVADTLAFGLVNNHGRVIVSGGALGVDAAAHRGALSANGATIAVLPCGLDRTYPMAHHDLFAQIAENGVLVSEYPPGSVPSRDRFLKRNRLIAALGAGAVVVEASLRSGSLVTARRVAELRRPLMAVPGPVTSGLSAGTNRLLGDDHAHLVTSAEDVMAVLA